MSASILSSTDLKVKALDIGFTSVGVCDAVPAPHLAEYSQWIEKGYYGSMEYLARHVPLKANPAELLPEAASIVAVALNYYQPNSAVPGEPRIATYALGRDYHRVLRGKLKKLANWVEKEYPGSKSRACVDSAPILERDYAHTAGLGWYGKNTCLIDSKRGSWFFIGLLLTSVKFESDLPSVGGCGTCRACIDACPTGAIVFEDNRWQVDARSCISYLTIEHEGQVDPKISSKIGNWTFGCDVCQIVCPFNQPRESQPLRAAVTQEPDFLDRRVWPNLAQLRQVDQEEWDQLTRGSAIRRTGLAGIRRNAAINISNEV